MKKILIVFVILLISLGTFAKYDFRKTSWGMSRDEVLLSEDMLPTEDNSLSLSYHGIVEGELKNYLDHVLTYEDINYRFQQGLLVSAEHYIKPLLSSEPDYDHQKLYQKVSSYLESQYGPGVYKEIWLDGAKEKKTNLIFSGKLIPITAWLTDRTGIILSQSVEAPYGIKHIYTIIFYSELSEEDKKVIANYPNKEAALEAFFNQLLMTSLD